MAPLRIVLFFIESVGIYYIFFNTFFHKLFYRMNNQWFSQMAETIFTEGKVKIVPSAGSEFLSNVQSVVIQSLWKKKPCREEN